jgi:hypothetical protein
MGLLHRKRRSVFYSSPSRWSLLRTLLYVLLGEVRILPLRMAIICRRRLDQGVDLGPLMEEGRDGILIPCMSTHAHIADMQTLFQRYPALTVVDWLPCLDAWEMGHQFGVRQAEARCYGIASSTSSELESLDHPHQTIPSNSATVQT